MQQHMHCMCVTFIKDFKSRYGLASLRCAPPPAEAGGFVNRTNPTRGVRMNLRRRMHGNIFVSCREDKSRVLSSREYHRQCHSLVAQGMFLACHALWVW